MTTAQMERAREAVLDYSDQTLIESVDHVTLNRLAARWFESVRDDFARPFEEENDGDWAKVAEAMRERQECWLADQIRVGMAEGSIPVPDQLCED